MSSLRLAGVAFSYPKAPAPVLHDVDVDLPCGWTAIAGPNGAGKTTLLRLIAGELAPAQGRVERGELALAYVRQAPEAPPDPVLEFAWTWDAQACRVRARLGLEIEQLERWPTLSGGERQRWQIAAALHRRVDALLLDEPTNHLDAEARAHLAAQLREHRGVGVIVAHDRAFLDALVERVLWVEDGEVRCLPGTYSEVRARQHAEHERRVKLRAGAKAERARLARELDARRRREAASRRSIGVRSRAKGPADSDAREAGRKVRAASAATKHAGAAKRMRGRADEARAAVDGVRVDKDRHADLTLRGGAARKALRIELDALEADGRTLVRPTIVTLEPEARVRLAGPNGCGKSTLLEAIVAAWPHPRDRLLYLPQREPDGVALLETIERFAPDARGEAWSLCAALGLDVAALRRSRRPSPGEARKLALAEGLAREVWCVVLDEPTNHLDVPSIERLEAALEAYRGALLLVTHDGALADAVTEQTWTLEGGALCS